MCTEEGPGHVAGERRESQRAGSVPGAGGGERQEGHRQKSSLLLETLYPQPHVLLVSLVNICSLLLSHV